MTKHTGSIPAVLDDPFRNRGVAFTQAERDALGLTGRLPSTVLTLDEQARRAWEQLERQPTHLAKNVYLEQLHARDEVLYYKVLADHLAELLPIVYDPTVGGRSRSTPMSTAARGASSCRSTDQTTSKRPSRPSSSGPRTWI